MFPILNEINNNSEFRTTAVVLASVGISCTVYLTVAIAGYISFGDTVGDNIVGMCKFSPGSGWTYVQSDTLYR